MYEVFSHLISTLKASHVLQFVNRRHKTHKDLRTTLMPSIINTPTTIPSQLVVKKRVQSCIQKKQFVHANVSMH